MQKNKNNEANSKTLTNANMYDRGIVMPPGCELPSQYECGESIYTFVPESYKSYSASEEISDIIPHHMMTGKTGGLSVPKNQTPAAIKSMTEYMQQFRGAYVCMDLWFGNNSRTKKCGLLLEAGENFLAIREQNSGNVNLVDLKPIRYITVYCK